MIIQISSFSFSGKDMRQTWKFIISLLRTDGRAVWSRRNGSIMSRPTVKSNLLEVRLSSRQLFKNLFRRFAENCEVAVGGRAFLLLSFASCVAVAVERDCGWLRLRVILGTHSLLTTHSTQWFRSSSASVAVGPSQTCTPTCMGDKKVSLFVMRFILLSPFSPEIPTCPSQVWMWVFICGPSSYPQKWDGSEGPGKRERGGYLFRTRTLWEVVNKHFSVR